MADLGAVCRAGPSIALHPAGPVLSTIAAVTYLTEAASFVEERGGAVIEDLE